jgi:hypothetical protein
MVRGVGSGKERLGMAKVKFYNVKTRESVEVDDSEVEVVTMKNGRLAARAEVDGQKLFNILSKDDAERLTGDGKVAKKSE